MGAHVFGTKKDVEQLAKYIELKVKKINQATDTGKKLLSQLGDSARDDSLEEAESILSEVGRIMAGCEEPCEEVINALNAYAEILH